MKLRNDRTLATPAQSLPGPDGPNDSDEARDRGGHKPEQTGTPPRMKRIAGANRNSCRSGADTDGEANPAWVATHAGEGTLRSDSDTPSPEDGLSIEDLILVHLLLQTAP